MGGVAFELRLWLPDCDINEVSFITPLLFGQTLSCDTHRVITKSKYFSKRELPAIYTSRYYQWQANLALTLRMKPGTHKLKGTVACLDAVLNGHVAGITQLRVYSTIRVTAAVFGLVRQSHEILSRFL